MERMTKRRAIMARKQALWNERSSWMPDWQIISERQQPRLGRFFLKDRGSSHRRRGNNILDNRAVFAARTLSAGLMGGMTSPARPWFKLALQDRELMEFGPVKQWLHTSEVILREIFAKSNTYNSLQMGYRELGVFGTWATVVLQDFDNVIHHYPLTIGEYALACNDKGVVDTLCREFQMTVGQLVNRFGLENVSESVRDLWNKSAFDKWIDVIHLIQPRQFFNPKKRDNTNMPWESVYVEAGRRDDSGPNEGVLSVSGFKRFVVLAPRWDVTGNDIYGTGPGFDCFGDTGALQHGQLRKAQAIDYQTNPPLQVPTKYADAQQARLPGGVFYVDQTGPNMGVRTAFEVNLDINALREDIADTRARIDQAYFVDLFLMLANQPSGASAKMTATEVAERQEEKLLMLGPTLERLHNELLKPKIDLTFDYALEAGILPPIPPDLSDQEIEPEFISVLALAQRMVSAQGTDRLLNTVGTIAAAKQDLGVWDKINVDQCIDDYADLYGVNPSIIVPDDVVAEKRAQREQAQQAAMAAAAAPQAVDSAKTASEIDGANLQNVMTQLQGYMNPSPSEVEQ